jgi:acyl-CoA thioesterase YciA
MPTNFPKWALSQSRALSTKNARSGYSFASPWLRTDCRPLFRIMHRMATKSSDAEFQTALRVVMMPRDANNYGSIFGGVILSYIDQAGYIEARRHGTHRWVTASIDRVDFHAPVLMGDVVSFLTCTESTGTSSVNVRIRVEAERYSTSDVVHVTEARLTMVAVNAAGKAIPFASPPTLGPGAIAGTSA